MVSGKGVEQKKSLILILYLTNSHKKESSTVCRRRVCLTVSKIMADYKGGRDLGREREISSWGGGCRKRTRKQNEIDP